jgi:hypothetical protein
MVTNYLDNHKQASTERGEGQARRNSSTIRISGRRKNHLLPSKRSRKKRNE